MIGAGVIVMGMRFRKSINLGGGFRVNLSKSGIGYSWGVPGYRITKTAKGKVRKTTSIPGTGIFWVEEHKVDKNGSTSRSGDWQGSGGISIKPLLWLFVGAIAVVLLLAAIVGDGECGHEGVVAATCENDAVCEDCEEITAPALGHEYVEVNSVAPTCEKSGISYLSCTRCGDETTEAISIIAHSGVETVLQEPTPLYEGKKQIECDMCGQVIEKTMYPLSLMPDNPIVLTADELLDAAENDIENAKRLYRGKWLQLTGKVVSVTHNEIGHYTRTDYGKTTSFTTGEVQYTIENVTIKSALIYWLAVNKRFERADIVVEMDTDLCFDPDKDAYIYSPQNSTVTVVAYCAAIGEDDIVLTDGRYPSE